jgi:hypothetical protein
VTINPATVVMSVGITPDGDARIEASMAVARALEVPVPPKRVFRVEIAELSCVAELLILVICVVIVN